MMLDDVEGKKLPDMEKWLEEFKGKLIALFGKRLVLFGIQGSYGREEQTANSDIDVVVIIDDLTFKDIQSYRDMLDTMEYRELICGFVAGKKNCCDGRSQICCSFILIPRRYWALWNV